MTTLERLQTIAFEQFGIGSYMVVPEAAIADLGLDSLDMIEALMCVEEEFRIGISDNEAGRLHTVGDVIDYLMMATAPAEPETEGPFVVIEWSDPLEEDAPTVTICGSRAAALDLAAAIASENLDGTPEDLRDRLETDGLVDDTVWGVRVVEAIAQ